MAHAKTIVIGLDQGTTNAKAVALDSRGRLLAQAARPIATVALQSGVVEQDAEAMYATAVACIGEVIAASGQTAGNVAALGIANQTETLVMWDPKTGKPALPAMVWQCRRGSVEIAPLQEKSSFIRARTGLDLDPTFTAAKLLWVFRHRPEIADGLRTGRYLFGTVDTWLLWKLTGGATYATDPSNASRTMLFDIDRLAWDRDLISLFSLDLARLPHCQPSHSDFGATEPSLFGSAIPIRGVMGDQQASLFGHGCFDEMQLKVTYGTGAFLWVNAGPNPPAAPANGIIRTIAWQTDRPCYAYEGFVMYAGKIIEWLAQRLAIHDGAAGVVAAGEQAGDSDGVLLVPAFQGLASPWWQPSVRAALLGMTEATSNGNLAHAGLESVCFQIRAILDSLKPNSAAPFPAIKVDGGMTRSRYFITLQASVLSQPLSPAIASSVTPFGAAFMAGLGAGLWRSLDELRTLIPDGGRIDPDPRLIAVLDGRYQAWRQAIEMLIRQQNSPATAQGGK